MADFEFIKMLNKQLAWYIIIAGGGTGVYQYRGSTAIPRKGERKKSHRMTREGFTQGDPVQDEGGKFIEDGLGQCTSGVPYTPEMIQ